MPHSRLEELFEQAVKLQKEGHYEEAVKIWRAIITVRPDDIPALNNMGIALRHLGRIAESEAVLRIGLERAPTSAELWMSLARTLSHWGVIKEAEEALQKAVILAPNNPRPAYAMGRFLEENANPMAAMAAYQTAIDIDENFAPALMALGLGWKARGEAGQSERLLRQAIKARPHFPPGHFQLAMTLLANGQFEEGWQQFEWRLAMDGLQIIDPDIPRWEGEPLKGRRLLIRCEQGMCEAIQFARLIKEIKSGETIFECPPAMRQLFAGSRIADEVIEQGATIRNADLWIPLLSLPMVLKKSIDNIQHPKPYLRADPSKLAPWRKRLGSETISIGIAWQGSSPAHENRARSIPLAAFAPLAQLPNTTLISLQKGAGRSEIGNVDFPILDMSDEMDEGEGAFLDTAAIMQSLTMIITVDSAIAHLAGALGRPVRVLTPDAMDWRWASGGTNTTPWYPSMELYPKGDLDWIDLLQQCRDELGPILANR